jgi:hypothetical protein
MTNRKMMSSRMKELSYKQVTLMFNRTKVLQRVSLMLHKTVLTKEPPSVSNLSKSQK